MSTENTKSTTRVLPENSKSTTVYTLEHLKCTPELYINIASRFPRLNITPKSSIEEIQYNAGQLSVISYLETLVGSRTLSGDQQLTIKPRSYMNRVTNFLRKQHGITDPED